MRRDVAVAAAVLPGAVRPAPSTCAGPHQNAFPTMNRKKNSGKMNQKGKNPHP